MLQITINVNTASANAQAVKEAIAMYLEHWGDSRVVSVKEVQMQAYRPQQQPIQQSQQPLHQQQRFY